MGGSSHPIDPLPANLNREHRAESVPPEAYCFVANIDPALSQQVLDVAKGERIFDVDMTTRRITSGELSK
jgi:hypothetical protein